MRSLLLGTVAFSRHCLEILVETGWSPVAVAYMGPQISNYHTDHVDLAAVAEAHGIPGYCLGQDVASLDALIESVRPDVVLVFGWPRIISADLLKKPALGFVGTHPALLPRNRGRHPIVWTLVDGETEGGLTFFRIDRGIDSGPILCQESFSIESTDHAGEVYGKMEAAATRVIPSLMQALASGTASARPQDEERVTYRRKRDEKDGEVDWNGPAITAYNLIRALAKPYAGAHTRLDGGVIKLWRAEHRSSIEGLDGILPGTIFQVDENGIVVAAADGAVRVTDFEAPPGLTLGEGRRLG